MRILVIRCLASLIAIVSGLQLVWAQNSESYSVQTKALKDADLYLSPSVGQAYTSFMVGQPFTVRGVVNGMCNVGVSAPAYVLCDALQPPPGGWPQSAAQTGPTIFSGGPVRPDREIVADVQRELNRIGCSAGSADGVPGARTKRALGLFLDITGAADDRNNVASEVVLERLRSTGDPKCTTRWLFDNQIGFFEGSWSARTNCRLRGRTYRVTSNSHATQSADGIFRGTFSTSQGERGTVTMSVSGNAFFERSVDSTGRVHEAYVYPSTTGPTLSAKNSQGCTWVAWKN